MHTQAETVKRVLRTLVRKLQDDPILANEVEVIVSWELRAREFRGEAQDDDNGLLENLLQELTHGSRRVFN
jgi:hypothetical protein